MTLAGSARRRAARRGAGHRGAARRRAAQRRAAHRPPHVITVAPQTRPAPTAPRTTVAPSWSAPTRTASPRAMRHARGAGVAEAGDAVEYALGRDAEPLGDSGEDAPVGLVVDEQVDVGELRAGELEHPRGGAGHLLDGHQERVVAFHLEHEALARDLDGAGGGPICSRARTARLLPERRARRRAHRHRRRIAARCAARRDR